MGKQLIIQIGHEAALLLGGLTRTLVTHRCKELLRLSVMEKLERVRFKRQHNLKARCFLSADVKRKQLLLYSGLLLAAAL